ncbi:MAG TPA: sensor histidine kinase [Candidatus Acidoferrales bacterium]|nr:sensor histidine kinase [Candidatus Acidoferrales bacterium]
MVLQRRRPLNSTRAFFIVSALLMVIIVGIVDYATSQDMSFSVFYLLALGLAAWFVGRGFATFVAVFSVVVSLMGDLASGTRFSSTFVAFWNTSIVLAFYMIVTTLVTRLRSLTSELETRVQERTAALTEQIVERERLEHELLEISEREQRRIGHDLHDSLGQHLTGAALAGQVLEEKLAAKHVPEAADAKKVVELVEGGIALSRKLAKGLHPIEFEAEGLMQALEELAAASADLFKISCRFDCDSPVLIHDAATSGHLYRIAQEAISNAIKHGKARNVVIHLETLEDGIVLEVRDDGSGLPTLPPKSGGMGLRIMAHRADMIGATFEAKPGEAGGTVVSCVVRQDRSSLRDAS